MSGWLALSTLAAAVPMGLQNNHNNILGEHPEQQKLSTAVGHQPLRAILQADSNTYKVRVIYMIPSNRSPQPDAQNQLEDYVLRMWAWYGEEMERLGYGKKSFLYETEADGVTPKVNFAYVNQPDDYFQVEDYGERWTKILTSIADVGFPPWNRGEVLLVVAETHIQRLNGQVDGAFVGGAGGGFTGVGAVTGETLARFSTAFLTDNRLYNGLIIPAIGPYPLVQDVTFPWFEGSTVSSTSSSAQGAALHELSHGFQLWHDFRNDANFNGNLMGNGLRGIRGALYPNIYPSDDTRLASGSALQLNYNRFFNKEKVFTEDNPPQVNIKTQGEVAPINGQCPIEFSASDTDSMLAGALLIRNGDVVAEMPLTGNDVTTTITTYDYVPGEMDEWIVQVFDIQGNITTSSGVSITCATGVNQAPRPYVQVSKRLLKVGDKVGLDAGSSSDPDGNPSQMTVAWDLNGDGIFDTSPSTEKTFTTTYQKPGVYQIIAKLTDEQGNMSKSMPIGIRVEISLPSTKSQCMKGGWKAFGFKNQGQCIQFVNTGK